MYCLAWKVASALQAASKPGGGALLVWKGFVHLKNELYAWEPIKRARKKVKRMAILFFFFLRVGAGGFFLAFFYYLFYCDKSLLPRCVYSRAVVWLAKCAGMALRDDRGGLPDL